jgi:hypothetical protein
VGGLFLFLTFTSVLALRSSMYRWLTTGTRRTDEVEEAAAPVANGELHIDVAERGLAQHNAGSHAHASTAQSSKRLAAAVNSNAAGDAIPFTSLDLSWSDLRYTVQVDAEDEQGKKIKKDRVLLAGINGFAAAGQLTALMGSSGAGQESGTALHCAALRLAQHGTAQHSAAS